MAIALVQHNNAVGLIVGSPKSVTVPLTSVSATDCLIVVCATARSILSSGANMTATWNGTPMSSAIGVNGNLNGFGQGRAQIFFLQVGTVSGLTANAVVTVTSGNSSYGTCATAIAYSGVHQTSPLNFTTSDVVIGASTSISESVLSDPTDRVVGCITFAELAAGAAAAPTSGQAKLSGFSNSGSGSGDATSHAAGDDTADAGANTAGNWGSFNSSRSYVMASFAESAGAAPPTITNVDGGSYINPNETNFTVNGTDLAPVGTTALYYADSTSFAMATKVVQPISVITSTSLNWDSFVPGAIGEGDNFLFVVTDEGGGGESVSSAFPILAATPDAFGTRVVYTCTGSESGPVLVVPVTFDNPAAAVIRATGNTLDNVLQNDASYSLCYVDQITSMGVAIGSSDDPESHQREQVTGTGSIIVHDGGSGPHLVEGTPSLSAAGLTIDFTTCTAGVTLEIVVFGGLSVKATVSEFTINDGAVAGLSFRPDLVMCTTVGLPGASSGDSTFALISWGVAIDDGVVKQFSVNSDQSNSGGDRNSVTQDDNILGQLQATSFTWQMSITGFDSDGYNWSGSNADRGFGLAIRLPGREIFLDTFNKTSDATPGVTQQLPDLGFEPGAIFLATTGRNNQLLSPVLGARWSIGVATATGQDVAMAQCLPPSGTIVCEQMENAADVVAVSDTAGSIQVRGRLIDFAQISTIQWVDNDTDSGITIGILAFDTIELDDGADVIGEMLW